MIDFLKTYFRLWWLKRNLTWLERQNVHALVARRMIKGYIKGDANAIYLLLNDVLEAKAKAAKGELVFMPPLEELKTAAKELGIIEDRPGSRSEK